MGIRAKKKRGSFISLDQKRTRSTVRLARSERRTTSIWPGESGAFSNGSLCIRRQAGMSSVASRVSPRSLQ